MARKKSEFLKAFGAAMEIWTAIVNAVLALGGNDDDLRRVLAEPGLAKRIAEAIMATKTIAVAVVSDWQKLFGHLRVWDSNFKEAHYPLEPEADVAGEVEEYAFAETVTGHDAVRRLTEEGFTFPGIRRCGQYIKANPRAQFDHPLVAPGAQWRRPGDDEVYMPVFNQGDGGVAVVYLDWLGGQFRPLCRWLVSRKKK
ncbi:MAG: hypothetical protein Q7S66_04050 [bacterium]|nr:hypothetical protein [bacterium]